MNRNPDRPWWAVITLLIILFPVGALFLIHKVICEKRQIIINGQRLIVIGAVSCFLGALGVGLAAYSSVSEDTAAVVIFGLPALALVLFGASMLIWGVHLMRKGRRYNRYLIYLQHSSERSIPVIAEAIGVNTMRALEILELLVNQQYIHGMYVDHGTLELKSAQTAKFAIRCRHCGGTSILTAGQAAVCEYCGAAL